MSLKLKILNKLSDWLVKRGSSAMITRNNEPYLLRHFLLRTKYFSVLLHRFYAPDDGGEDGLMVHSHPWDNISIILFGGYDEAFDDGIIIPRKSGFIGFRQARVNHRIDKLNASPGEVYTCFITFRRKRIWGFNITNFTPVTQRTDSEMRGWFLPKSPKQLKRDEKELFHE